MQAFGKHPDAPINVGRWDRSPQVFDDCRPYEVRINSQDTYWCQYVYEFSHELCHILTNFDEYRRHPYKWFEEALCETATLFVLHGLAEVWETDPPRDVFRAREYAPSFRTYAQDIERNHPQPGQDDLPRWLHGHMGDLVADPYIRESNRTVAIALLPQFLEDPALWRDCAVLNLWNAGTNTSFSDYLGAWAAHLQPLGRQARVPDLVSRMFLVAPGTLDR